MYGKSLPANLLFFAVSAILLLLGMGTIRAYGDTLNTREGWFAVLYGDGRPGTGVTAEIYTLTDTDGQVSELLFAEELARPYGGILALNRKYVSVETVPSSQNRSFKVDTPVLQVSSLSLLEPPQQYRTVDAAGDESPAVSGSKPWVSIMCKFSDIGDEPEDLAYFQGMYVNSKPGLDHYWREVSYNNVNIVGSDGYGWFTLPHQESYYNPSGTLGGADLNKLFNDCTAAADGDVDFSSFSGINMMFNSNFDRGYAWGGSRHASLDGVSRTFYVTWEPPWGYRDITVIAHEMGHGFGLPHSSGMYGKTYDNEWDVMSDSWANCNNSRDATYGCLGQHTIAYHKSILGWLPGADTFVTGGEDATVLVDDLALLSVPHYRMIKIPIQGSSSNFYTVEVRRKSGYDIKLPGEGVIIHEVDVYRSRDAHVLDLDYNGDTGDDGAIFSVGETYTNQENDFSVEVISETATGYEIAISFNISDGSDFPWNLFFPGIFNGR